MSQTRDVGRGIKAGEEGMQKVQAVEILFLGVGGPGYLWQPRCGGRAAREQDPAAGLAPSAGRALPGEERSLGSVRRAVGGSSGSPCGDAPCGNLRLWRRIDPRCDLSLAWRGPG